MDDDVVMTIDEPPPEKPSKNIVENELRFFFQKGECEFASPQEREKVGYHIPFLEAGWTFKVSKVLCGAKLNL